MIAAVLEELKKPLVIHRLEIPKLEYGQILVEIKNRYYEIMGW